MTETTNSIFGKESSDVKPPKLPTISQFVKKTKQPRSKPLNVVEIIWIPGQFDNYTLQTKLYRVIIVPNHPFYEALGDIFRDEGIYAPVISIRITDWDKPSYMLEESKGDKRGYEPLSTLGYKLKRSNS